jgi:hypothetical protein
LKGVFPLCPATSTLTARASAISMACVVLGVEREEREERSLSSFPRYGDRMEKKTE